MSQIQLALTKTALMIKRKIKLIWVNVRIAAVFTPMLLQER